MAKLEGYKAVAVTKEGYYKYSYAIYDDGAMIYDRRTNELELFGNVRVFKPKKN